MYAPAFSYGFRQLGHEVIEIDYERFHLRQKNVFSDILNRFQDRCHIGMKMYSYNKKIIDTVNKEKPNIVFLYRCYHVYNSTLKAIKDKVFLISYNNDDPFSGIPSKYYYYHHIQNAALCDINYVYRKKNIEDYNEIGIINTKILLPYYLSSQNIPLDCEKDIPIAFLGHFEDDGRDKYIWKMKEAGLPIVVYGDSKWKNAPMYEKIKDIVFPDKRGIEYNNTINRCLICPITGSVMLSEYTDDMNNLFPSDRCAVYFRNSKELVQQAKRLLDNSNEIEIISKNAFYRVREMGGSELDRCQQIIKDYIEIQANGKRKK